jgi:uncharacterized protein
VGGYLKLLHEKFGMIDKRLPILAKPKARKSRYYLSDNFLIAWLAALEPSVDAAHFRPPDQLVERANGLLEDVEGHALERLVAKLRGRLGDAEVLANLARELIVEFAMSRHRR